ncbi:MAG: hypothetical protein Q9227_003519 [Pyrenula ochraceoflavens]
MLLLALQYAASGVPWSSARVIGLLVGAGATAGIFAVRLGLQGDKGLLPPRILKERTVIASSLVAATLYGVLVIHIYYLPTYFQAIRGTSAIESAVDVLPYIISCSIFSIFAGILVTKIRVFAPPCIIGCAINVVGAGLLATLRLATSEGRWIGYQLLSGIGIGLAINQSFTGVQAVLPEKDAAIGTSLITFSQAAGGALAVSIGDAVLLGSLRGTQLELPSDVNIDEVIASGATAFRTVVPHDALTPLLQVYDHALSKVFIAGAVAAAAAFLSSLLMEFKKVDHSIQEISEVSEVGREQIPSAKIEF